MNEEHDKQHSGDRDAGVKAMPGLEW